MTADTQDSSTSGSTLRAVLWRAVGRHLFRLTFHNWNAVRRVILQSFGAEITLTSKIRRTVLIDRPWNLRIGAHTVIGDHAALRTRETIHIGQRTVISQYAILSTEMRDACAPDHQEIVAPIHISDDCWVATDTLVLPGVTISEGTVVGARSLVDADLPAWRIAVGQPARPRAPRTLHTAPDDAPQETTPAL